jgi:4'-phosphopantetheinyl transferase
MALDDREARLWVIQLSAASEPAFEKCQGWLAEDERARAARFRFEEHRRAYIVGRGVLRALTAAYTGEAPGSIRFSYGERGKPALQDDLPLRFNVSNSGEFAAYAFTSGCEVGVDIERIRPMRDLEAVARRFFCAAELDELLSLGELDRPAGFFNCWTRKEAYIKAVGDGLYVPLDSFQVSLRPGDPARMIRLNGTEEAALCWTVDAFDAPSGYAGAIAYGGRPRSVALQPARTVDELLQELR